MRRWSRPAGIAISAAVVVALVIIGLRSVPSSRPAPPPDLRNGRVFIQDNLWSTGSRQYAVWVGPQGTPFAGVRRRGGRHWKVANLARLPGNPLAAPTPADEHDVYEIATDASGGVHVAGNMHSDPLRYVWSGAAGFGAWETTPAPPAPGPVTYPAFTALPDGTLLFWCRIGAAGEGRIIVDSLAPGARSWRSLGTVLDGRPSGESPYLNHIAVDPRTGAIHLLFEWRGGGGIAADNDVGYARSLDGGRTFETSDRTPLSLPITHGSAETVIDTPPRGSGLVNQGGLTVDSHGRPHGLVVFERPGGGQVVEEVWLDRGRWHREDFDDLGLSGRPQLAGTPDGRVWLLGVRGDAVEAIDVTPDRARAPSRELARVPVGWEVNYDDQALARLGRVEMLIPRGNRPHVVAADLTDP